MDFVGINQIYKQNIIQNKKTTAEEQKNNKLADTTSFTWNTAALDQLAKNNWCLVKNISFGGNETDFEQRKEKLLAKIKKIGTLKYFNENQIKEYNIQVFEKIVSNKKLYNNKPLMKHLGNRILHILKTPEQCKIVNKILANEKLHNDKNFINDLYYILLNIKTLNQRKILNKILNNEELYNNENIIDCLYSIVSRSDTPERLQVINKILADEKFYNNKNLMDNLSNILCVTSSKTSANAKIMLLDKFASDEKVYNNKNLMDNLCDILCQTDFPAKAYAIIFLLYGITTDEKLYNCKNLMDNLSNILEETETPQNANAKISLLNRITADEKLYNCKNLMDNLSDILKSIDTREEANIKISVLNKIISDEKLYNCRNLMKNLHNIIIKTNTPEHANIVNKILGNEKLYNCRNLIDELGYILDYTNTIKEMNAKISLLNTITSDEKLYNCKNLMNNLGNILDYTNTIKEMNAKISLLNRIRDEKLYNCKPLMKYLGIATYWISPSMLGKFANKVLANEKFYNCENLMKNLDAILKEINSSEEANTKMSLLNKIASNGKLYNDKKLMNCLGDIILRINDMKQVKNAEKYINLYLQGEIFANAIAPLLEKESPITYKDVQKLIHKTSKDFVEKLSRNDLFVACKLNALYNINNINEIRISDKKDVLRGLVASNAELFSASEELRKYFPLIPKNKEEYCTLLPQIVKSLGIETNILKPEKIADFNNSMNGLSQTLASLSTQEFANLQITQDFSKDDFIKTVINKTKDLSDAEKQKVYDYYGFELHSSKTCNYIGGYPLNINNGKKLTQIEDTKTKAVVESLRNDVIRFSEQKVHSNNPQVEKLLNEILSALPELQAVVDKKQHRTHDFTVMKHSLKVMQKIAQDEKFKTLNESDKKIMMLASLLHDITKIELQSDKTHPTESSFDTFFIAKKFNLTKEEEIKLYKLIKHHEWLAYANSSRISSETERTKRLQSVAFDLQQDNLFDMALIFTHADLKSVKYDDSFHNKIRENGLSYGQIADEYAEEIKEYIEELKATQPLLPVSKFPKAKTIRAQVTTINADGSTNIKGVYVDKDGLVIVKYNEVENWEDLGFPKGTISRGISATGLSGKRKEKKDVDTGNIKFFAHGLDYSNQLAKFNAFSLVDSDALLSVSYAERPETKYRFFRPQGVLLDVDTKYVYGGGNTDGGSGYGKNIQEFKNNYIFGGIRETERTYIADMIKKVTGMTTEEYIKFVEENKNKSMLEIEPKEIREKIIKAFATINSNTRNGEREYNEMYISNPNVMGVFAYAPSGEVGNPVEYVATTHKYRTWRGSETQNLDFLKQYALEKGIPFIFFGE